MGYDEFILIVNGISITTLTVMALLLCSASRFRGESSYAALFILFTTIPDFIYNVCGYFNWNDIALLMAPIAYSVNLTLMPFILFLTHRSFNPYYRFRYTSLLHFLPATIFAVLVVINIRLTPADELEAFSVEHTAGFRPLLTAVNFLMISLQLICYFYSIFRYLRKVKHYIFNNQSQADLSGKIWIPRLVSFIGALMVVAMVSSLFDPLGGFQLFYFINVVAMGYLLYSELQIAFAVRNHELPPPSFIIEAEKDFIAAEMGPRSKSETDDCKLDKKRLEHYARQVEEYLRTSEVYVNSDLSLKDVATAIGVSSKNLSKAINTVLGKNFFDLVNGFRIEKSKALLVVKKQKGLTLETIAERCGFNSRITFNNAFKKLTGVTTTEWLKLNQKQR